MTKKIDASVKKYRFTVMDYHRMGDANIFGEHERVELIHGEIIEMSPIKSPHAGTVNLLNRLLGKLLNDNFIVSPQNPIELNQNSEPEPDLSILKYRADLYTKSHPKSDDVVLLVEVADSSLEKDRELKMPLYAAAGIPEAWIVNLQDRQVEVYTQASEKGYAQIRIYRNGEVIESDLFKVNVDAILI